MSQPNMTGDLGNQRTEYAPSDEPRTAEQIEERRKTNPNERPLDAQPMTPAAIAYVKDKELPGDVFHYVWQIVAFFAVTKEYLRQLKLPEVTPIVDKVLALAGITNDPDCERHACDHPDCRRWVNRKTGETGSFITPRTYNLLFVNYKTGEVSLKTYEDGDMKGKAIRVGSFIVTDEFVKNVGDGGVASFNPTGQKKLYCYCQEHMKQIVDRSRGEKDPKTGKRLPGLRKLTYARAMELVERLNKGRADFIARKAETDLEVDVIAQSHIDNWKPGRNRNQGGFKKGGSQRSGRFNH